MLYTVQGRSGTGKTKYVCDVLAALAKQGERKLLYLIPEQSSFESETRFLHLLGAGLCRNVNVMSFTRLYDMVMRATGYISGTPIDDGVRGIIMSAALEDCCDELEVYKRQAMKPQLTELMLGAVKEFKMCGITPDDLRGKAYETSGKELGAKLKEAALIMDVYNSYIEKSYIDPLDNYARLEKRLAEVKFFDGYTIAADGFSGFTSQEQKILNLMLEQCKDFYITLCMDSSNTDESYDLFYTVERTKKRIIEAARSLSVKVASPIKLDTNYRTGSRQLLAVEKGIYHTGSDICDISEKTENSAVTIAVAGNIFEECDYIAEKIQDLALGGVCRYRDIAVICRSADKYRGILDAVFESHKIPYFMSKPEPIDTKPVIQVVLSALEYAISPSDAEKIFAIAKSGLLPLNDLEVSNLENYAYVWSIKGKRFWTPFDNHPDGYGKKFTESSNQRLEEINISRVVIMEPLLNFINNIKNTNAERISEEIYNLLEAYNVPQRLREDSELEDYEFYSNEEIRLWDILNDMLNKIALAIGDRAVSVKRYYELFKMMVRSVDISDIPQTLDQVTVGTANSIRLSSPSVVFVIGAINGEFPHNPVASGIFSDAERRSLISVNLPLYDSVEDLSKQEKFLVYNAVSAPRERLFVTYYNADLDGSPLVRSSIPAEIERIIPNVKVDYISAMSDIDRITSEKTAFERFAAMYRQNGALSKALKSYFSRKPEYKDKISAVERAVDNRDMQLENKNIAAALFGKDKVLSASQVEKFYLCRFQYFCTYGLKLKERRRASMDAIEYGNLIHYLLENILKTYKENGYIRLSDNELEELLDKLLKAYIFENLGGEDDKDAQFMYLYNRLKTSTQSLMRHMSDELEQSEFKPVDFELQIGSKEEENSDGIPPYSIMDADGNKVSVIGKVDRVDLMQTAKANYVRIIDYKSGRKGQKDYKVADVLYGLNMQMLIYLSAIAKNGQERYGENIHPSGILYVPSTVSTVSVPPNADDEAIKSEHDDKLKMRGIILDEPQVIKGMESDIAGRYIPVSANKDGSLTKSSGEYTISAKQLNMLFDKVEKKLSDMSVELGQGSIEAVPTKNTSYDACAWCICKPVCGFSKNGKCFEPVGMKKEEVMKILEEENGGED